MGLGIFEAIWILLLSGLAGVGVLLIIYLAIMGVVSLIWMIKRRQWLWLFIYVNSIILGVAIRRPFALLVLLAYLFYNSRYYRLIQNKEYAIWERERKISINPSKVFGKRADYAIGYLDFQRLYSACCFHRRANSLSH